MKPGKDLLAFFLLAYALAWLFFVTIARTTPPFTSVHGALATLGAFAPGVVAVGLTWGAEGRAGVRRLLEPALRWQLRARWYAFALLYTVVVKLTAALVLRVSTGAWPRFESESLLLIPFAIAISAPFQAGEEVGWRGYALPRLAGRIGLRAASLVLGAIWAVWHLPLFYAQGTDTYLQSFGVYLLSVMAISVAMGWLLARTGSLWIVMLLHAAVNNSKDIVPSGLSSSRAVFGWSASPVAWLTVALLWAVAAVLLARMPKSLRA